MEIWGTWGMWRQRLHVEQRYGGGRFEVQLFPGRPVVDLSIMTSIQPPTTPTRSAAFTASVASPHYTTTRRHSLYGTEDRIIIDPGSRIWKVGFSGEGKPRDVFLSCKPSEGGSLWRLVGMSSTDGEREEENRLLECRLQDQLRRVFLEWVA